jgi:membrane protein required for colicin V production
VDVAALDWIALAVLAFSLAVGAGRGLIVEVLSLLAWLLAFWAAYLWSTELSLLLPIGDGDSAWRLVAAFVIIFLGVVMVVNLLASSLKKLLSTVGLGPLDRLLGAVFGVARAGVLLLLLALALRLLGLDQEPWWRNAHSSGWLAQGLQQLQPWLPGGLNEWLQPIPADGLLPPGQKQLGQPAFRLPV